MTKEHAIWTEKYRPNDFSEIKGQKEIVARVKAFVMQKNMPHQLYSGPAGVGKSTLAIVVAKKLFGVGWRQNFLELNASDTRGIDTIRLNVKDFARTKAIGDVPFKIIFLDFTLFPFTIEFFIKHPRKKFTEFKILFYIQSGNYIIFYLFVKVLPVIIFTGN